MSDPIRLSKYLAAQLPCSRREAEQYIAGGWVLVDGKVVEEPQFKVDTQTVSLALGARLDPIVPATILLHLPPGHGSEDGDSLAKRLITPASRAANDASGIRPLKAHFSRLTMAAPLESGASGLAVFTQDHRVIRKLKDDISRIEQEIVVEVSGTLSEGGLERLARGVRFEGRLLPPAKVSWQSEARLRFALKGLCPGQIEAMCRSVGLRMLAMKRLRLGRVPLAKLAPGEWRYLPANARF
nr:rRNA pseudouridine synthase [uncultured Halomonas sp.]